MEKMAMSVIDDMDIFFTKYLKLVKHPKCLEFEGVVPKRLEIEWATKGNSVDCGVFAMRHMETWFGEINLKWDSGFPIEHTPKIAYLTRLRKKYAVKFVCSHANTLRDEVMAQAIAYNVANRFDG
ncbi:putative papain-like cysteine peptidase superfamily [Helianthus anomalus]